jgi:hypothetical protein
VVVPVIIPVMFHLPIVCVHIHLYAVCHIHLYMTDLFHSLTLVHTTPRLPCFIHDIMGFDMHIVETLFFYRLQACLDWSRSLVLKPGPGDP